ncbi:hypothetical protein [Microbispora sp. H10836]|uniref:hypothetical protein n=1 Tax=Microbispora sp. H10836 TaxID=2729106 RepID=UPI001475297B|nr:hypothetical protein [Microbispora sp. H10836]
MGYETLPRSPDGPARNPGRHAEGRPADPGAEAEWQVLRQEVDKLARDLAADVRRLERQVDELGARVAAVEQGAARHAAVASRADWAYGLARDAANRADDISRRVENVVARTDGLHTRVEAQESDLSGVRDTLAALVPLQETVHRLAETVDLVRERRVRERDDLTRDDFLVHFGFGARMKALLTQRLPELTETRVDDEKPTDVLRREAELVREMSRALTEPGDRMESWLTAVATDHGRLRLPPRQEQLLARVCAEADDVRRGLAGTGHRVRFDFDLPFGTVADPEEHEIWTACAPGEEVDFVVTPAYYAQGRKILPPSVFTRRERGE